MILWIIYCIFDGISDAFMFYNRKTYNNQVLGHDIHVFLTGKRFIFLLPILFIFGLKTVIACSLVQPFIHNGFYFETRKRLDNSYPVGFFTTKEQDWSTAKIDFDNAYVRSIMFVLGLAVLWL